MVREGIDYEYMNDNSIDNELKCTICKQPYQSPVSLECNHIFCFHCITTWADENASCPLCRCELRSVQSFTVMTNHIILCKLDRLLVWCIHCNMNNIKRHTFGRHFERCSKAPNMTTTISAIPAAQCDQSLLLRRATTLPGNYVVGTNRQRLYGLYHAMQNLHFRICQEQEERRDHFSLREAVVHEPDERTLTLEWTDEEKRSFYVWSTFFAFWPILYLVLLWFTGSF
jgi:hypothetical protein